MENRKITIINATGLYPPQVGGPATRSIVFEKYFPDINIDVTTVKFSSVLWLPRIIRHIAYLIILLKKSFKADMIVSQDAASVGWPALMASNIYKKPLLVILVGDFAWEQGVQRYGIKDTLEEFATRSPKDLPRRVAMYKRRQTEILKKADWVVVPSNYLKNIVSKWGVPIEKITVIYNPIEIPILTETKENLRKKFGWNKKIISSAGRNVPWKGFDLLKEVVKEIPEADIFIAHALPREELLERIAASDLFVLNTGYEGFSHLLLEVMSLGVPIVTTDVGGNPELIQKDKEGVLLNYNDKNALKFAIQDYIKNPQKYEKMARIAQEKARSFTVKKMINELSEVIRKTV